jgi:hypothetical protein
MLPPEPDELTSLMYSCGSESASEYLEKCKGEANGADKTRGLLNEKGLAELVATDE